MIAVLRPGKTYEGFTPNKKYKMNDSYEISSGVIRFDVVNDNNEMIKLNERLFNMYFYGGYADTINKLCPNAT